MFHEQNTILLIGHRRVLSTSVRLPVINKSLETYAGPSEILITVNLKTRQVLSLFWVRLFSREAETQWHTVRCRTCDRLRSSGKVLY